MKHVAFYLILLVAPAAVCAQTTSYPMLMSLKPVAAQAGQASEHEVQSRYSLFGATKVLVSGEGVSGEVVTPMEVKPGEKPPNLTKLKVKFTVSADAMPGVRDFRIATPQGVSTLGQLVVVRDPVVAEAAKNDAPDQAQEIAVAAAVCGTIERNEDVDFFKFQANAGQTLTFHVRSMRLQDAIHDLQTHADPIIAIRHASGTTLAQADNTFAADPLLTHRFEQAGEYLLEIRDVRYQGNAFWEYCVEISGRPFVRSVFPPAVARGQEAKLQLVGANLPADPTAALTVPADAALGDHRQQLALAAGLSDPVPMVVSDLPLVQETEAENNEPAKSQPITLPAGVNGRIEAEADVDCYAFDAKKGDQLTVEVVARRLESELDSVIRILNDKGASLIENDDLTAAHLVHGDSRIETWTAPADGRYTLEIRDLHLRGGAGFVYFIKATRPEPLFELRVDTDKTQLTPGTSSPIFVRAIRKHGFTGEIQLHVDGLPAGVAAHCGRILAGKPEDGCIILTAAKDAPQDVSNVVIRGTAAHALVDGTTVELAAVAQPMQEIYMPGGGRSHWLVETHVVSVAAPSSLRGVKLSTHDVTLKPGESATVDVEVERSEGFKENVTVDVLFQHLNRVYANTLPPGVTIDTKASKTLLTGANAKGQIVLTAAKDAAPVEQQQVAVMATLSINFVMKATYCAEPLRVTVVKP